MQPLCECFLLKRVNFKSKPHPSGDCMCISRPSPHRPSSCRTSSLQIFANRCVEQACSFLFFVFFFDQSRFNKSSWLDANVTFCMWKDEATEGLVLIRPKLINGRFKLPPCYCGETPEVEGLSPDWYQLRCCSFFSNPMNRSIIQQTHSRLLNWSGSSLKAPIFYPPFFLFQVILPHLPPEIFIMDAVRLILSCSCNHCFYIGDFNH